jgi:DNA-directed RNA polymerase specialized sigma24 family protein
MAAATIHALTPIPPPRERRIATLRFVEGLTQAEIGSALEGPRGASPGSCATQLNELRQAAELSSGAVA